MKVKINISRTGVVRFIRTAKLKVLNDMFKTNKVKRLTHIEPNPDETWYVQSVKTGKVLVDNLPSRPAAVKWEKKYYDGVGWKEIARNR